MLSILPLPFPERGSRFCSQEEAQEGKEAHCQSKDSGNSDSSRCHREAGASCNASNTFSSTMAGPWEDRRPLHKQKEGWQEAFRSAVCPVKTQGTDLTLPS